MKTFTGLEYIQIDIANNFGLDKLNWEDRIAWVDKQTTDELMAKVHEADNPMLMLKGIYALEDALEGKPTGFIMGLDATASGLQIMATLTGCKVTASAVNLTDTGKRECPYQKIADDMGVERSLVKKPIMTTFYGSTAQPKAIFGEDTPELQAFYDALSKEFPGAMDCMDIMQGRWDPMALEYKWTLPDGHTAVMKVLQTVDKKIEIDEFDHATFTYRTIVNEPMKKGLALAANIVHSVDGWIVREMVRRAHKQGFELLTIHDSFWASPNHMNQVRQNYLDIFMELSQMNLLQDIIREITKNPTWNIEKDSDDLHSLIANCEYALS